jgi:hypothetical protein
MSQIEVERSERKRLEEEVLALKAMCQQNMAVLENMHEEIKKK